MFSIHRVYRYYKNENIRRNRLTGCGKLELLTNKGIQEAIKKGSCKMIKQLLKSTQATHLEYFIAKK
jgi:hypothetical protein